MQGIEIAKAYWEQYGRPAIEEQFPELMKYIAVGLVGSGSECYGFDDELSRDHDFGPGFCIFLPGEDIVDRHSEFLLERACSRLPREFMGTRRELMNPAGGNRCGVFRTDEWYRGKTGIPGAPSGWRDFIPLPDYALAEVTNGEVFLDEYGEFSSIRRAWQEPPEDYVSKKICGALISMSQSGEYNYPRCRRRGDLAAAHLCADEFVKAAITAVMWSCERPVPYYKWSFRALRELEKEKGLPMISEALEEIFYTKDISELIKKVSKDILQGLKSEERIPQGPEDLQSAALWLDNSIKDAELRNLSPLAAV